MSNQGSMRTISDLIKILPQIAWIFFAFYAFHALYGPFLNYADRGKISELSAWQVQIKFAKENLAQVEPKSGGIKTPLEFAPFEERIKRLANKIAGASILWVDDNHPTQNLYERKAFAALGINIDMVKSTQDAISMINLTSYDLIITDLSRPTQADEGTQCGNGMHGAGCGLLRSLHEKLEDKQPPTLIYSSGFDPEKGVPGYAFGMTNRTDYLLQFVLDAVERRKPID